MILLPLETALLELHQQMCRVQRPISHQTCQLQNLQVVEKLHIHRKKSPTLDFDPFDSNQNFLVPLEQVMNEKIKKILIE